MKVTMEDVFGIILKNANMTYELEEKDYPYIRMLFRYYHDDIRKSPRCFYDGDAVYFYNFDELIKKDVNRRDLSERGDIMMSIWMPFIYYSEMCKGNRKIPKNDENLNNVLTLLDNHDARIIETCSCMEFLSQNYWTRGNLLLLPNSRNKLGKRNLNSDRGKLFEDKIDQTLWHCFEDEVLAEYFSNDNSNVEKWIRSERLECLFSESFFNYSMKDILNNNIEIKESICRNNLQPLIPGKDISSYRFYDINNESQWKEFFNRINKIIAYRNTNEPDLYKPFEW